MRIWLINVGEEIPSDPGTPRLLRTGILAGHLAKRGHDVTWWNSTVNHQRKEQRSAVSTVTPTAEGYRLALLYGRLYGRNISLGRIASQVENAREFARLAPTLDRPDVIVCGYPTIELAQAAVRFAKARNIPIAVDFRDLWPDVIVEQTKGPMRLAAMPVIAYWQRALRYIVRNTTAVIGVTDSFVDWALEAAGRQRGPRDRAFHLAVNPELPDPARIAEADRYWDSVGEAREDDVVRACFIGTFSRRLDISTLIEGAKLLPEADRKKFRLLVCGKGDLDQDLRNRAKGHEFISFPGWRNAAEIHSLLKRCDFGTLPYCSTPDFVRHYPNKVGEYLGAGLPIMTPLTGQVRTLLAGRDLGFFYEETNPQSAAECLSRIIAQRAALPGLRDKAYRAYQELFDSRRIYGQFCDYVEALGQDGRR